MPDELLLQIAHEVGLADLGHLAAVSQRTHAISQDATLTRRMVQHLLDDVLTPHFATQEQGRTILANLRKGFTPARLHEALRFATRYHHECLEGLVRVAHRFHLHADLAMIERALAPALRAADNNNKGHFRRVVVFWLREGIETAYLLNSLAGSGGAGSHAFGVHVVLTAVREVFGADSEAMRAAVDQVWTLCPLASQSEPLGPMGNVIARVAEGAPDPVGAQLAQFLRAVLPPERAATTDPDAQTAAVPPGLAELLMHPCAVSAVLASNRKSALEETLRTLLASEELEPMMTRLLQRHPDSRLLTGFALVLGSLGQDALRDALRILGRHLGAPTTRWSQVVALYRTLSSRHFRDFGLRNAWPALRSVLLPLIKAGADPHDLMRQAITAADPRCVEILASAGYPPTQDHLMLALQQVATDQRPQGLDVTFLDHRPEELRGAFVEQKLDVVVLRHLPGELSDAFVEKVCADIALTKRLACAAVRAGHFSTLARLPQPLRHLALVLARIAAKQGRKDVLAWVLDHCSAAYRPLVCALAARAGVLDEQLDAAALAAATALDLPAGERAALVRDVNAQRALLHVYLRGLNHPRDDALACTLVTDRDAFVATWRLLLRRDEQASLADLWKLAKSQEWVTDPARGDGQALVDEALANALRRASEDVPVELRWFRRRFLGRRTARHARLSDGEAVWRHAAKRLRALQRRLTALQQQPEDERAAVRAAVRAEIAHERKRLNAWVRPLAQHNPDLLEEQFTLWAQSEPVLAASVLREGRTWLAGVIRPECFQELLHRLESECSKRPYDTALWDALLEAILAAPDSLITGHCWLPSPLSTADTNNVLGWGDWPGALARILEQQMPLPDAPDDVRLAHESALEQALETLAHFVGGRALRPGARRRRKGVRKRLAAHGELVAALGALAKNQHAPKALRRRAHALLERLRHASEAHTTEPNRI